MRSIVGKLVDAVLVQGLELLEAIVPMPERLGAPLDPSVPTARHADPVVLVSGFANSPTGWNEWKRSLEADGFRVFVIDLHGSGLTDLRGAADQLAAFVAHVKRTTGRSRVDLVGFSEGGLLARMYVAQHGGATSVDRAISLATPHGGIDVGSLHGIVSKLPILGPAIPEAAAQMLRGSEILRSLDAADAPLRAGARGSVRYASVFSQTLDGFVTPWSARLEGATNIPVRDKRGSAHGGPNHFTIYHASDRAYEAVRLLLIDEPDRVAYEAGMAMGRR